VTENLSILELEVEKARDKLAKDLAVLRSPQTYREFGTGLKAEAQSVFQSILDDLKARAAANPSAALAIGAGVAWRLLKQPPIATALIGAGMLSLWRTKPVRVGDEDYLSTAQQSFVEQVSEAVDTVKNYAAETAVAAREKAAVYAQSGRESLEKLAASAADEAAEALANAREAAAPISQTAVNAVHRVKPEFGHSISDEGVRDQLLFGVAGLAVMAALGIAYQRRISDELRALD
jgi:hypothetical protein